MPFRQAVPSLTAEQIAGMREKCLWFLENRGLKVENERLLGLLAQRGAVVEKDTRIAR